MDRINLLERIHNKKDIDWKQITNCFDNVMYTIDTTLDTYIINLYYRWDDKVYKTFILEYDNYEYVFLVEQKIILKTSYVSHNLLTIWYNVDDFIDVIVNGKLDDDFVKTLNEVLHYIFRKKVIYV